MNGAERKAAVAAYKERKTVAGVYAVRCSATGQTWVGESRHLDTQQNGMWFALKQGSHMNKALQAAWTEHGEAAFSFEQLHRIDPDLSRMAQGTALRESAALWRVELGAAPL
jgi:hypothetical protein